MGRSTPCEPSYANIRHEMQQEAEQYCGQSLACKFGMEGSSDFISSWLRCCICVGDVFCKKWVVAFSVSLFPLVYT